MPAPVENIAYMDAVEIKPTTQQLKAAAASAIKGSTSAASTKNGVKPHVLGTEAQASYFPNKFI
ncbi:hypothetical protein HDU77_001315 [Chytriomyces hyalinus]|nr:hypothetical protein HDU77_001315 [Chytriomyces hyalinus]